MKEDDFTVFEDLIISHKGFQGVQQQGYQVVLLCDKRDIEEVFA